MFNAQSRYAEGEFLGLSIGALTDVRSARSKVVLVRVICIERWTGCNVYTM